jgi:hypothetical protein
MSNKLSFFDYYVLKDFYKKYNINKNALKEDIYFFRYFCMKMNYFMKKLVLPKFKKEGLNESVIVEFRKFPHLEFIIRNTIFKLGGNWCHTVICGNNNYNMMTEICNSISNNIKIIKLDIDNITQSDYSHYLMTPEFWNLLKGEKILIYQEDSIIFKNNIDEFMDYDFIGAPFRKNADDTPNSVGNGGLSLRTKRVMMDIISKFQYADCDYNNSTLKYMEFVGLECPPEDVYFSKCMQENDIGLVADWDIAYDFSTESVYNKNSFAGHKFWISDPNWKIHLKQKFYFNRYKEKSDLNKYLKYIKKPENFNKNKEISNAFDIDFYFFCKANNFEYNKTNIVCNYFKSIGMNGFIYHPKQLKNFFLNVSLYNFMNNIYISTELNFQPMTIQDFLNKYLYNSSFDFFTSLLIKKKYSCLNNNFDILFLVFIGNEEIGIDLIDKIIEHKKINSNFNISFCFNSDKILNSPIIKNAIKNNFDYYAIYKCKELGTDITPTLLMYNEIIKTHQFNHIYKFHTKSILKPYNELTNYLLKKSLDDLLVDRNLNCNCIGNPNHYLHIDLDVYNNKLKNQYNYKIDINCVFVAGTIFYTDNNTFYKVLDFVKNNNYRSYLLNNLYENNSINMDFSPIHFIERLFGIIM